MNRERRALLVMSVLVMLLVASAIFIGVRTRNRGSDESRIDYTRNEEEVVLDELNVTVLDAFRTDRITTLVVPYPFTAEYLVLEIEIINTAPRDIMIYDHSIDLWTMNDTITPNNMSEFIGRGLPQEQEIPRSGAWSGYLYYTIFPDDKPIRVMYSDLTFNTTFNIDLRNTSFDFRPWTTPLQFSIAGCGRDENGSGRERFLYFFLEVRNPNENATHFLAWLLDLECHNGVQLDGLFINQSDHQDPFRPGRNLTLKVYFDIPRGSPDLPKVLYQDDEGMYIDIESSLYEGLI